MAACATRKPLKIIRSYRIPGGISLIKKIMGKTLVERGGRYKRMADGEESKVPFCLSDIPPEVFSPAGS